MNARCNRPTAPDYERYGGRGITICARWGSFEAFLEDMGERPAGLTLDRKDNGGNYEKSNCRWATAAEQNRNTRASKLDATKAAEARHLIAGGRSRKAVARMLDVSPALISYIASGKRWALARAK